MMISLMHMLNLTSLYKYTRLPTGALTEFSFCNLTNTMAEYLSIRDPDRRLDSTLSELERTRNKQHKIWVLTKWIIIPLFVFLGVATIIVSIFHFICGISGIIAFGLILSYNVIGSISGATMVYKYSNVFSWVQNMKLENGWYEMQVNELDNHRESIYQNAKQIHFSMLKLERISKDLDNEWKKFDGLRRELAAICDKNEEMKTKLKELSVICDDLSAAKKMNERAHLMSIYFSLCSKVANRENLAQKSKLNRAEFEELMDRLDSKNRKRIEKQGGFEIMDRNNDELVDVDEFMKVIDQILGIDDDERS